MLDDLGRLAGPHSKRKGVHEGLRPALPPARAFVVHPELGKVQSPEVASGRRLERIRARHGRHQASVDVMKLGVVLVSVALKDGMEDGKRGGRAREGREAGRKEGLLLKRLQQSLQVGARAVGGLAGVGRHHFRGLNRNGARQIGRVGGLPVGGNHKLEEERTGRSWQYPRG